ncbi:MAG TPA: HD domain-containing protein [Candidatus Eisenbacteria bacterium]|nr:HD domain-containing protein [Candidatus Eisenbacteria bacterium]
MSAKENRESFCRRLKPILAMRDLMLVEAAYVFAKHGHRAQFRKETDPETGRKVRYFEHPRRAALILIDEVRCVDPVMIEATLIHDCFEDSDIITPEFIEHTLGPEVTRIVKMLSKVPKEGYLERLIAYADWRVLVIKACDRLDNLRSLGSGSVEFQKKQIFETEEKYYPVFDLMVKLTPKVHAKGVRAVRDAIKAIVERYKAEFRRAEQESAPPPKVRKRAARRSRRVDTD